jgi:hypothetical protein
LAASAQDEDGIFGGWIRFHLGDSYGGGNPSISAGSVTLSKELADDINAGTVTEDKTLPVSGKNLGNTLGIWGYAWWKPLDILKVQFGANPDGHYGDDGGIVGWGFYKSASTFVVQESWKYGAAFPGGDSRQGAYLYLTPIEPLAINFSVPLINEHGGVVKDVYKKFNAMVNYQLPIGNVSVQYSGALNNLEGTSGVGGSFSANAPKLAAHFGLRAIENFDIDLGIGYPLPVKDDEISGTAIIDPRTGVADPKNPINITVSDNVSVGLGLNFTSGQLGIKARMLGQFGGNTKAVDTKGAAPILKGKAKDKDGKIIDKDVDTTKRDTVFVADLLPSFAINDSVSAFLSTGLSMTTPQVGDTTVGWHINPYVNVKGHFWAGVRIESDGVRDKDNKTTVNWSIPLGLGFGF